MALSLRSNGSGANNLISASWFNDFYNLLTGAMTDQPVSLTASVSIQAIGVAPGAPSLALATGSTLGVGVYRYAISFIDGAGGETVAGTQATITTTSGNQSVTLSIIPTGPTGTVKRRIWRSVAGGTPLYAVAFINDNTTTTYTDTMTDVNLGMGTGLQAPANPSFGGSLTVKDNSGNARGQIFSNGAFSFNPTALNGEAVNSVNIVASAGAAGQADVRLNNLSGGIIYLVGKNAFASVDQNGVVKGNGLTSSNGLSIPFGSTSLDNGAITTNGAGNMTIAGGLTIQGGGTALVVNNGVQAASFKASVNTAGANQLAYRALDAATGLDWQFIVLQTSGAFTLWDNLHARNVWTANPDGSVNFANGASVGVNGNYNGPIGGGIPTTRNGAALSVPIFTGTSTPVNPPTGSIWIKA